MRWRRRWRARVIFGLAPGLRLARASVGDALKEGGRTVAGSPHRRLQHALVSVQVALAFLLVVASGLLLRSFVSMIETNPGFQPGGVITASIELPTARYDRSASTDFYRRAAERVRALARRRCRRVQLGSALDRIRREHQLRIVGRRFPDREGPEARYHFMTAGYTQATGTPLVAGRDLTLADAEKSPAVVLLNESAARRYWSSAEAAVGARLNLWGAERTVAGVIGDVKDMPWHTAGVPALYFPQPQMWYPQPMFLIARARVDPSSIVEPLRRALREIDPELPLASVRPLEAVAGAAIAARRLTLWLVAAFGATALFLALVGIYGVMAQGVSQRRHEFGVRQALGATRGDIVRLVFSSGALMTLAGLVAGIGLAIGATPLLASLLYRRLAARSRHVRGGCGAAASAPRRAPPTFPRAARLESARPAPCGPISAVRRTSRSSLNAGSRAFAPAIAIFSSASTNRRGPRPPCRRTLSVAQDAGRIDSRARAGAGSQPASGADGGEERRSPRRASSGSRGCRPKSSGATNRDAHRLTADAGERFRCATSTSSAAQHEPDDAARAAPSAMRMPISVAAAG